MLPRRPNRPTSRRQWLFNMSIGVLLAVVGGVFVVPASLSVINRGPSGDVGGMLKGGLAVAVFAGLLIAGIVACVFTLKKPLPPRRTKHGYWPCRKCGYDIGPMDHPVKTCPECGEINDRPF